MFFIVAGIVEIGFFREVHGKGVFGRFLGNLTLTIGKFGTTIRKLREMTHPLKLCM